MLARERSTPASASSSGPDAPENAGSAGTGTRAAVSGQAQAETRTGPIEAAVGEVALAEEPRALAAAMAELRARLQRADRVEAAARARGEPVPDPDDPTVDYWAWYERQLDPPPPDAGPWPRQTVTLHVEDDGRIVSGPLCDADGRAVPISAEWFRARTAEDLLAMRGDGTPRARCFACSSTRWWRLADSVRAHWICGLCHPPLVPADRVEWFDGGRA